MRTTVVINLAIGALKRTSFQQMMFKGAVMIVILLQTACATQFPMVGRETSDWNAPNPSKLAANDAGITATSQFLI